MGSLEPIKLLWHFGIDQFYGFRLIQSKTILIMGIRQQELFPHLVRPVSSAVFGCLEHFFQFIGKNCEHA